LLKTTDTSSGDDRVIHLHGITITETQHLSFNLTEKNLFSGSNPVLVFKV